MALVSRVAVCVLVVGLLGAVFGCGKETAPTSGGDPAIAGGGPAEGGSGNALFDQNCANCHSLSGSTGGPKRKGPDLSKVGAAPDHTADWIAEHIKNPKMHKPGSGMPPFEGKLKPEEIKQLADFLAAKK